MQRPAAQQPFAQVVALQTPPSPPLPPPLPPPVPPPTHWKLELHVWPAPQATHELPLEPHVAFALLPGLATHVPLLQHPLQFCGPQFDDLPQEGTTAARKPIVAPSANALNFIVRTSPKLFATPGCGALSSK